jgi:hypothetical protein
MTASNINEERITMLSYRRNASPKTGFAATLRLGSQGSVTPADLGELHRIKWSMCCKRGPHGYSFPSFTISGTLN